MKSEEAGIEQMEFTYEGVKAQLIEDILPFWLKQVDTTHGGFYGLVDENLIVDEKLLQDLTIIRSSLIKKAITGKFLILQFSMAKQQSSLSEENCTSKLLLKKVWQN